MDWDKIKADAIAAVQGVLGGAWNAVSAGATAQITLLVNAAKEVDDNSKLPDGDPKKMTPAEYKLTLSHQKMAMQNVLKGYEAIGEAAAINAVAAVVNVIINAASGVLIGLL